MRLPMSVKSYDVIVIGAGPRPGSPPRSTSLRPGPKFSSSHKSSVGSSPRRLRSGTVPVSRRRNVEVVRDEVRRIVGDERVEGVELSDGDILPCEGAFIAAGKVPNSEPFRDLVETDDHGYIVVDSEMRTSLEGVYSAGDVTTIPHRNLPSAVHQGSVAGINAAEYALRSR